MDNSKNYIPEFCECPDESRDHGANNCFNKPTYKTQRGRRVLYVCDNCCFGVIERIEKLQRCQG